MKMAGSGSERLLVSNWHGTAVSQWWSCWYSLLHAESSGGRSSQSSRDFLAPATQMLVWRGGTWCSLLAPWSNRGHTGYELWDFGPVPPYFTEYHLFYWLHMILNQASCAYKNLVHCSSLMSKKYKPSQGRLPGDKLHDSIVFRARTKCYKEGVTLSHCLPYD